MELAIGLAVVLMLWYGRVPVAAGVRWTAGKARAVPLPAWTPEIFERLLIVATVAAWCFWLAGFKPPIPFVPPGPDPPPDPPIPVVVEGTKTVVILHEAGDDTPAFSRMVVALRAGANAEYLTSKGHRLLILDDESNDQDGNPDPLVSQLSPRNSNWPAVFILDGSDGRPLHDETLSANATADDVMRILREHGG